MSTRIWRPLRAVRRDGRLFTVLALFAPLPLLAQSSGTIQGRVVASDGGVPIVGAFILVDSATRPSAQTDGDGHYHIPNVAAGAHTVQARRVGYAAGSKSVTLDAGAIATADLSLTSTAASLAAVTIIGTRGDLAETRERLLQIAGGVDVVEPAEIRSTRQANLNDVLRFTPGIYVQSRFGAADESQISVRGSGLRNNFHARGINLLVNGMPYRNADGFTDFESLELLTTDAIEVYKGANALRYGGSTLGGAINLDTKTGFTASPVGAFAEGGSFGFGKAQVSSGADHGPFDYYASYAHTTLDGFRQWSDQRRDRLNLHAGYRLSSTTDARAFYFFAHVREHLPGSLTQSGLDSNAKAADPTNVASRWGRDYDLQHVGVQLRTQLTPSQRIDVSPYLQYRDIDHPIFEVIAQISHDWGAELRYENTARLVGRDNRLTIGVQPAYESMHNRQYQNLQGNHGALTRDEQDYVTTLALYAENALSLTSRLTATAGLRFDNSTRKVTDDFLSNGDQSDRRTYAPVTPRLGLMYTLPRGSQLFANASRTVEPPLLLELSSFGNPGGFTNLRAQDAWQYETGARGEHAGLRWDLSLYDVELRDEILNLNVQPFPGAPFTVPTYRNAPRSRHYGLELGLARPLANGLFVRGTSRDQLTLRAAYTFARYEYVSDPTYRGNEIPGAPRHYVSGELAYAHPSGFSVAPTVEWVPTGYFVNSANTVKNGAWSNLGFRAEWAIANAGVTAFANGRNLADRRMSASVQVDNAAGKYFEPSDGRAFYAGLRWSR